MLSPVFGLGVDNMQQFHGVLPNGTSVTANRCKNPDVFFALRGGGGGTFGLITEMSTTAHKQVTLQYAKIDLHSANKTQIQDFLRILAANANRWVAEGWGGATRIRSPSEASGSSTRSSTPTRLLRP